MFYCIGKITFRNSELMEVPTWFGPVLRRLMEIWNLLRNTIMQKKQIKKTQKNIWKKRVKYGRKPTVKGTLFAKAVFIYHDLVQSRIKTDLVQASSRARKNDTALRVRRLLITIILIMEFRWVFFKIKIQMVGSWEKKKRYSFSFGWNVFSFLLL